MHGARELANNITSFILFILKKSILIFSLSTLYPDTLVSLL